MKNYIATYTEDKGMTYKTVTTTARTYTEAYINIALKISASGEIAELFEII